MKKGIILTLLAALMYGFTPVLGYISYKFENDPITLTFFRNLFVFPVLLSIILIKKLSLNIGLKMFFKVFFLAIFGALSTTILLYSSYTFIGVGTSTTLHFLYPLFILFIGKFMYKDHVSKNQMLAMVVSIFGIFMFVELKDLGSLQGLLYALFSGVTYGTFILLVDKWKVSQINSYVFAFYISIVISVFMLVFNQKVFSINFNLELKAYVVMFFVAMLASFIGVIFLKEGIKILGSQITSMICLVEPVSAMIFGLLFLKDAITKNQIIGMTFILTSMLILSKKDTYEIIGEFIKSLYSKS